MRVIVDTNAYHRDVYASGQDLSTLFRAAEEGELPEGSEIWTPAGVVEELVRQYSERARRMAQVVGAIKHDLSSFRLALPDLPRDDSQSAGAYRAQLEARLVGPRRKIAAHPTDVGRAIDWAAQRRFPVRAKERDKPAKGEPDLRHFQKPKTQPVTGVVDAAIWLTVIEAAKTGSDGPLHHGERLGLL